MTNTIDSQKSLPVNYLDVSGKIFKEINAQNSLKIFTPNVVYFLVRKRSRFF